MPFPDVPLAQGALTLRRPRADDAAVVVPLLRDPEIPLWTRVPPDGTPEDWHAWLATAEDEAAAGRGVSLLVEERGLGVVGSVGVHGVAGGCGEVGPWVAAHARRRGIAARAVRLLTAWAHAELGARRLELLAHVDNRPSQRVARAAGYADTGQRRRDVPGARPGAYLVFASEGEAPGAS
ncbi:MAG: GNAT family N-acetyltransferase [Actinomycetota bacterium]|nr:GNAT family N-acetyltransferase [Actinomycetota bacterium]